MIDIVRLLLERGEEAKGEDITMRQCQLRYVLLCVYIDAVESYNDGAARADMNPSQCNSTLAIGITLSFGGVMS